MTDTQMFAVLLICTMTNGYQLACIYFETHNDQRAFTCTQLYWHEPWQTLTIRCYSDTHNDKQMLTCCLIDTRNDKQTLTHMLFNCHHNDKNPQTYCFTNYTNYICMQLRQQWEKNGDDWIILFIELFSQKNL